MKLSSIAVIGMLVFSLSAGAESQPSSEYPGVQDPFADPSQYEFTEEEKEDKEFFHLGRFLMLGIDVGAGIFTGGLGASNAAGVLVGFHLVYFFDKAIAFEGRFNYSNHLDSINDAGGNNVLQLDVNLMNAVAGFRYYFDTKSAPRAIAVANPYLAFGAGVYMHSPVAIFGTAPAEVADTTAFGGYAGVGAEFLIYRKHVYLGLDLRYHMIFFPFENGNLNGLVPVGDRGGDFFSSVLSLTYNF